MRYVLLLFFVFLTGFGFAQRIQIEGVEVNHSSHYPKGPLYVIRQNQAGAAPEGNVVFVPGGDHWKFSWIYEGDTRPVIPYEDSTRFTVPLLGNGFYTFIAEKEGEAPVREEFHVFYDFMEFNITLTDVLDCEYITIHIDYLHLPDFEGFPGEENVDYWVNWDGKERQLSSMNGYKYTDLSQSVAGCTDDASCRVRIKDRFGFVWESQEVIYESVIPKAEAELELLNTVDVVGVVNEEMGQAPLEVIFHNNSVNADTYEWLLYKDTTDMNEYMPEFIDSLIDGQIRTQEEFSYIYEHTGRYKVHLVAVNDRGNRCRDTTKAYYVNVVESMVDVPNVFTPNGDGKNDIFMVRALSVEDFHGVILNRWGRKIYEWSDPMGGWDGRIGGKYASPGTYYYVITARGREKNNPPRYVKKGALMLIR